ncbi:bacillithiol biosynthesis cysteine-adding enzyme BshC [Limnovirga soli]|uniref:Putative cysteine ligase BshC n=1 Tax=Limnovirga soli TaxID=2656915 RepID=A0A8J8FMX8_9BACT|nr:bacillithiol biosynthesis cysteine-adding enzyme BshC [Limnovirga soli]NNV57819.1 bacillithiol biosynthesis cysteine-adding enzyme BshC [Limnovirga soli]
MESNCTHVSYEQTGYFSKLATDYISGAPALQPFYQHQVNIKGIQDAITARQQFPQQRDVLVKALETQYHPIDINPKVAENIQHLRSANTFTITTAHQPNIFTGPLFFMYKILHAIKLAAALSAQMPHYHFVPVYYMGSEDADLDELGSIQIDGITYRWQTNQTGAVGRMQVDKSFISLIDAMQGQLGVLPFGNEIIELFRKVYQPGTTIQQATLALVNALFGAYGLLVIIPDNPELKQLFHSVVEKELTTRFSNKAVSPTLEKLDALYKVQAAGRELNLFYLINNKRERIEIVDNQFVIAALALSFSQETILQELQEHPERFSANVILRGVFQETILPNIAFIGGGGELAYWLELKAVFEAVAVPYPVLILRNSFLYIPQKWQNKINALSLATTDIFKPEFEIMNQIVAAQSTNTISLQQEMAQIKMVYNQLHQLAGKVDKTLEQHVLALYTKTEKHLAQLQKKMLRAEKRKFATEQDQVQKIKTALFPGNSLQERVENIAGLYARYGPQFIAMCNQHSLAMEQQFTVVDFED